MQNEQRKKLDNLLAKFENKQEEIKKEVDKKEQERNLFLDQFEIVSNERIKPIMDEIGTIIKGKGHDYTVVYSKETKSDRGTMTDPRITMQIYPNGIGKSTYSNNAAHVMFFADKYKNEISLHENTIVPGSGGHSGTKSNKYNFDTLTVQKIEEEIVGSIDNILNKKY